MMTEPLATISYLAIGFVVTYLSLEIAWHFTACRIKESDTEMIKPCLFKQAKSRLAAVPNPLS